MVGKNLQEINTAVTKASSIAIILFFLWPGSAVGQVLSHPVMASRDDARSSRRAQRTFPDTVHMLAAMVQFQQDDDPLTTGDGRMELSVSTEPILDAPPRNRQYFEDHLTFLQNYYRKSSKGKVLVQFTVVDSLFTLPNVMATYSPPKDGSFKEVADLAVDTWRLVDSSDLVQDYSLYESFVVFHAGVGRDLNLVGTLGFDPAPRDIPSLYIGLRAFQEVYGESFEGIPVQGGSFLITNSMVIPETESRMFATIAGDELFELTINGLLSASLGNHLGLPDLFDTETGQSGIGRFGLMDGGIFSFRGVFPPEPSAWEKYWLGWLEPIQLPTGSTDITLPAVALADTVYRVPISSQEYFLVENRNRDPLQNGQTVTSTFNGVTRQQFFSEDTVGFNAFDIDLLAGVIIDVEDVDWSLPGGVDRDGVFFDGGVLVWHIDEAVIAQTISFNRVNANPDRRGVDVEEADGSQDIGQQYEFLQPGSGSEEGTALDFWYRGNSSPVNQNEFSLRTFPDSRSNLKANSSVTMSGFSERAPRMIATVTRGNDEISPLPSFPKLIGEVLAPRALTIGPVQTGGPPAIHVATRGLPLPFQREADQVTGGLPGKLFAWDLQGDPALQGGFASGWTAAASSDASFVTGPALTDLDDDGVSEFTAGENSRDATSGTLRSYAFRDVDPPDSLADPFFETPVPGGNGPSVVVSDSIIAFAQAGPRVYFARFSGTVFDSLDIGAGTSITVSGVSRFAGPNAFVITGSDGTLLITSRSTGGGTTKPDRLRNFGAKIMAPAATALMGIDAATRLYICFATENRLVHLVDEDFAAAPGYPVTVKDAATEPPVLADIDGDGRRDVVATAGSLIYAWNQSGAVLDGYPVRVSAELPLVSAPIVGDVDGDGIVEIVAVSEDGLVVAHGRNGARVRGFPLPAGRGQQSAAMFTQSDSIFLAVSSSDDGSVSAWLTGMATQGIAPGNYPWPQYQKDAMKSGLDTSLMQVTPISNEFFPSSRAYNWPNPVYEGKTFIRYFVNEDATVAIRIFDLVGDLVAEFPGPGIGGLDNEVEWDARDVQSGVYYARIEANGGGKSGVAVIKVAVVK